MVFDKIVRLLGKHVPDDYFTWLNHHFRFYGLMPPKNRFKKILYLLLAVPQLFSVTFLVLILEWINVFQSTDEPIKLRMLYMSFSLFNAVTVFRILVYLVTKSKVEKIKMIIRRKSFNFECFKVVAINFKEAVKIYRPGASLRTVWRRVKPVFTRTSAVELYRLEIMFYTRFLCVGLYLTLVTVCVTTNLVWHYQESKAELYEAYNPYLNKTSLYRVSQMKIYLPFDTSLDGYYWTGFFISWYTHLGSLVLFLPIDNIIISSIIHLISQTKVVKEAFKHIDKSIYEYQSSRNVYLIKEIRIVKCINELQEIYRAIELLEKLCSFQMLIQYGLATFLLCTLTYVFPMMTSPTEIFCVLIFLTASLGEIFMCSYVCQTLSLELQGVTTYLFRTDWPFYPLKMKKQILFTIKRLQKPASLTAGKFFKIDLVFFIQILQRAYSFYTLISNSRKK